MNLEEVETSFESPTRGEPYTGEYLMQKFLQRGCINGEITLKRISPNSMYGDKDMLVFVSISTVAQMQNSPTVELLGNLPLHVDYAGKLSIGWATTCKDVHTNKSYWSHSDDIPYRIGRLVSGRIELSATLNSTTESFDVDWGDPRSMNPDTKMSDMLLEIIKEVLLREKLTE